LRSFWGRAGWNLLDQMISSGTNAVLSFLVARQLSDSAFGGFAVAFTVFSLLVGASRAISTAPLGMRFADAGRARFARASSTVTGTALALGAAAGAVAVVTGLVLGGDVGRALVALGLVLPGLLVQDAWRDVFFAAARPAAAALNDAAWAVVQLLAVVGLLVVGVSTAGPLVLAWGAAAAAAAVLGGVQARARPAPARTVSWLREHRDVTRYLIAEFAVLQGAQQGAAAGRRGRLARGHRGAARRAGPARADDDPGRRGLQLHRPRVRPSGPDDDDEGVDDCRNGPLGGRRRSRSAVGPAVAGRAGHLRPLPARRHLDRDRRGPRPHRDRAGRRRRRRHRPGRDAQRHARFS